MLFDFRTLFLMTCKYLTNNRKYDLTDYLWLMIIDNAKCYAVKYFIFFLNFFKIIAYLIKQFYL